MVLDVGFTPILPFLFDEKNTSTRVGNTYLFMDGEMVTASPTCCRMLQFHIQT